jgi:hypothetical protein
MTHKNVSAESLKHRYPELANAIVRVGDGRGFIIEGQNKFPHVITAAQCLPHLPPPPPRDVQDDTYPNLLGPFTDRQPKVWATCVFVDPIADIALLSPPKHDLFEEWEAYLALTEDRPTMVIAEAPKSGTAWLLTLEGRWSKCEIVKHGPSLEIKNAKDGIRGGMSGSPILREDGKAISLVSMSSLATNLGEAVEAERICTEGGPSPCLTENLPSWLFAH